jgi:DNA invertase Pin-like site-specific DNA recombinase
MPANNKSVAIYIRVASRDQLSLEGQRRQLCEYASANGYGNTQVYADNGYGGLDFDRPAFSKLEADLRAGSVCAVIVRDISRISRDVFAAENWTDRLADRGVPFIALDRPYRENLLENLRCFKECGRKRGR